MTDTSEAPDQAAMVPERASFTPALEVSKRPSPLERIAHLWRYRELIANLTRKELKIKYKNSALGFLWSLLNPLMYLVVFSVVFSILNPVAVPYYGIFFLSGLLAWNLFSTGLIGGTTSITLNAQLVTKVWFPREALVLASIFAPLVHFLLQSSVLLGAMLVFRQAPDLAYLPVLALAMAVLLVFCAALAIALSAVNVYLRDTQHLLEVGLLAWFWLSAIVYPYALIAERLPDREWIAALNPMLTVVITFQRTLHDPANPEVLPLHDAGWYVTHLAVTGAVCLVLLYGALRLFSRLEDNFAEEI